MSVLDKTLEAADEFKAWFTKTMMNADGNFDHLPDWLTEDMRRAWDAGRASTTSAGVTEEQVEALADFLCSEFDADFNPVVGAVWPEHADDDGYRGNRAYVRLQPSDVQAHARDNARRILTFLGQRSPASRVAPVSQKEAVPVAWQWRGRARADLPWSEWREGKLPKNTLKDPAHGFEFEERALYASPAPAGEPVGIKALEPFAHVARLFDHMEDDGGSVLVNVKLADLRRARSALHPTPSPVSAPAITRCQCEHPSLIHQFGKGYHCTRCGLPPRMNLNITKEWFERKAAEEGDLEIGVGSPVSAPVGVNYCWKCHALQSSPAVEGK